MNLSRRILLPLSFILMCLLGCSEGMFWKTGSYVPWAREKWEQEREIADTLFEKRQSLDQLVAAANTNSLRQAAAQQLKDVVERDPVLLLRLHAVKLLGELGSEDAVAGLVSARHDPDSKVRLAAVRAFENLPKSSAVAQLQDVIGSDTDIDVRLAATRALANFKDSNSFTALSMALSDSNPAVQVRAIESLEQITGQNLGTDVAAWQNYLDAQSGRSTIAQGQSENGSTLKR